jgi:hypothetical protein
MSLLYQELDAPHFDYGMQPVSGIEGLQFRGPTPDLHKPYIACIGGAQTMGRFSNHPYPQLLGQSLGRPCLNLGIGGAGPRFALQPNVLALLQQATLVVVQVFSGRSASNSRFDNSRYGRNRGRCVRTGKEMLFENFFEDLMSLEDEALLRRTVQESREDYAHSMSQLAHAIPCKKVLLWLSHRQPAYETDFSDPAKMYADYPQLIDEETMRMFRDDYDAYIECAQPIGRPQTLWAGQHVEGTKRDDQGQLWNNYYPTPEMHAQAAKALLDACQVD